MYPFDYYYRQKHKIAFGSPEHRATNFILMAVDLKEETMIKEYLEELQAKQEGGPEMLSNKGMKMSKKEIDEEFDNLDINQFNKTQNDGE